jgi:hypothetical protein
MCSMLFYLVLYFCISELALNYLHLKKTCAEGDWKAPLGVRVGLTIWENNEKWSVLILIQLHIWIQVTPGTYILTIYKIMWECTCIIFSSPNTFEQCKLMHCFYLLSLHIYLSYSQCYYIIIIICFQYIFIKLFTMLIYYYYYYYSLYYYILHSYFSFTNHCSTNYLPCNCTFCGGKLRDRRAIRRHFQTHPYSRPNENGGCETESNLDVLDHDHNITIQSC